MTRLFVALAAVAGLLWPCAAQAEPVLRPTGSGLLVIAGGEVAGGGAIALSLGYNTENEPLIIEPHLSGAFGYYAGAFSGPYGRALAGMRFGAALSVEPALITRVGWGYLELGAAGAEDGRHGAAFQTGPSLEHRLSRAATVGGELLYDLFVDGQTGDTTHALLLGLSFGFSL